MREKGFAPPEEPSPPTAEVDIDALAEAIVARLEKKKTGWLTVREAAAHVKKGYPEVYRLVAEGEIPSYRAGGPQSIRIDVTELDEWVRTNKANDPR
jgi:excisionase family DNA binding protein